MNTDDLEASITALETRLARLATAMDKRIKTDPRAQGSVELRAQVGQLRSHVAGLYREFDRLTSEDPIDRPEFRIFCRELAAGRIPMHL